MLLTGARSANATLLANIQLVIETEKSAISPLFLYKIKKVERIHLFCPKSYHELNLLMLWLC